ncbi:MAG: hypothetical protein HC838_14135 [Spirulinaceae cyanobacterium RM2_2_10]|nr:hypothetical protein [Spirulinaceae cyanobacterium SM2_1_0]NJO20943.1 hypothetical protein [Spirulinaceae cyanobacterium RM2_2_10]
MTITIRTATLADVAAIAALHNRCADRNQATSERGFLVTSITVAEIEEEFAENLE